MERPGAHSPNGLVFSRVSHDHRVSCWSVGGPEQARSKAHSEPKATALVVGTFGANLGNAVYVTGAGSKPALVAKYTLSKDLAMNVHTPGGASCQSCGAPMSSKKEHGGGKLDNPYCSVCTDSSGKLMSYKEVHERMTTERFMKVQGMPRKGAEDHAERALKAMPAWKHLK